MLRLQKSELKVLRAVFSAGKVTRSALARRSRLSLVKVSSILGKLETEGFLLKDGKTRSASGRPSYLFRLRPELACALGVSVGVDHFRVVGMDGAKRAFLRREFPLELAADPATHSQAVVGRLSEELERILAHELPCAHQVTALGVALPGLIDTRTGTWLQGLWLSGIAQVPIVRLLAERLGLPVFIDDIARSAAYYEMHLGAGRGLRDFVLIYLGSGVGSGVVINRRIYRGFHGLAGEIGHIEHPDNAYRCSCSNVGCLETMISPAGILRVFRDRLAEGVISSLQREPGELDLSKILAAADQEDRFARATLHEIGGFLGDACAILVKMFNPQRLIVSGEGAAFRDYFTAPVDEVIRRRVLPEMLADYRTVFADYQSFQEAHGAALAAMNRYLDRRLAGPEGG
jgi:predicted NBD/HSP70 family sugar kinase